MSTRNKGLAEDGAAMPAPTMSAGSGQIAGIGVGPQGEPGVNMAIRKKKWKQEKQKSKPVHVPTEMISGGLTEGQKPLDIDLWQTAQLMAKSEYPQHPTPESTKFAIAWYLEHGGEYVSNTAKNEELQAEDLRNWFGKGKTGGIGGGGWDRYNTKGERIGKCGDAEDRGGEGEGKPKCLSKEKAAQLRAQGGKQAIANAVKRKKAEDPVTDRKGTGGAPRPISNRIGESVLAEKNVPTNPELWSRAKSEAKKRFDVYPSAYANGWAAKWYKKRGGGWKSQSNEASSPAQQAAIAIAMKKAGKTPKHEDNTPADREWGTDSLVNIYKKDTPGQLDEASVDTMSADQFTRWLQTRYKDKTLKAVARNGYRQINKEKPNSYEVQTARGRSWTAALDQARTSFLKEDTPGQLDELFTELVSVSEAWEKITKCQQCKAPLSPREQKLGFRICDKCVKGNKGKVWGKDSDDDYVDEDCGCGTASFKEALTQDPLTEDMRWLDSYVEESEYQGRKVTLGKPFRTPSGPKKFSVYVKNDKGNVVKVNFGDPKMEIKRDDPARRKNFRARHGCDNPGPRWKAKYWSCRFWSKKSVSKMT